MLGVGKKNFDEQKYSSMSLNDMVIAITKNPKVFEGKSYIIIDKIKTTKNKGEDGWAEINKSWGIVTSGKAKEKIDKYFKKGLKVDRDPSINKNVKINISDKETTLQPIDVKDKEISSAKNEYESSKSNGKIGKKLKNVVKKVVKNIESEMELKKSKRDEESEKINKVECDSFDDLINDFKTGEALSKNELSHIKFLMSYIRTKEPIENEDNIRKELEDVFVKITNSSMNIDDKYKVLHLYREQRFLSIYNSSCRVASYAIESLLEKQNFPREIITKVKDCLIDYSNEYLSEIKSNESEYNEYIKNIKKYLDFDVFEGVESVERINLIKGVLSESKFTSENRRFLTELSHNLTDGRIIDFVKERVNSDIKLLKNEYGEKCNEEKTIQNEAIDASINRVKSMLIMKSISKSIVDSVIEIVSKKRIGTNIDVFSSKVDLIINILQYKGIKSNKITNDIEHYLDVSMDKLKLEVEIAKSKKISFQERLSSLLNNLNNRVLNFIYYVRHSFK
ncbi:hypothetical protein [Providencia huaxiensis]|uniref:hypothetical protein n=1 Tax=Providencia huaxiensis TaxID=2027290 RepID=UPI0034E5FEA6